MSHWLLDHLQEKRVSALAIADNMQIFQEIAGTMPDFDISLIRDVASALELVTIDTALSPSDEDSEQLSEMRKCAGDTFRLLRMLPIPAPPLEASIHLLKLSALGVLADKGADAARLLRNIKWPEPSASFSDWGTHTWLTIADAWLRLIRKQGWEDRDLVLKRISELREKQTQFEQQYLMNSDGASPKKKALELIGFYHLAKAAEILALFITDGVVEGNYQVQQLLDTHFDRVFAVCDTTQMLEFDPLVRLLNAAASQMVKNSIWTVTRAVNSRVTQFVKTLVNRGRGNKALFDVLPPQRRALAEKGLLGSSRRAVVVSLPTSSGKTLIAQFRILQALNQFDNEEGWVAYLAPTRALVNQVTRQLRNDFFPLSIIVEKVSPALDIDSVEDEMLQEEDAQQKFRVLVTTPEKLDLMLRQGWEEKIGRPLTLVVVDEAHNIQSINRGLKLELLLSTINKECVNAQFLLLTPFIKNAREVARWLGGQNAEDISLSLEWQPNDRAIGIVQAIKDGAINGNSFDYHLGFDSVHTSHATIATEDLIKIPKHCNIAGTYGQVCSQKKIAAVAAQYLKKRGPVIVMHSRPDWVWALAEELKIEENRKEVSKGVSLVQDYLRLEFGTDFPLITLLEYGIGVHHAGLSEEVRSLMEWLFTKSELDFLVATTTIAQGINFPVSGVVMASHQYFSSSREPVSMPPEDFWNIAGRSGRVSHGQLGVVALAAQNSQKADALRAFVNANVGDLNSALVELAIAAGERLDDLQTIVYSNPEWSSFLQYLAHTYRQMGDVDSFSQQIEQVLRGTLGFEKLRAGNSAVARRLLAGVDSYGNYLRQPGQPLKLVDSTGFSLQSIKTILTHKGNIDQSSWNSNTLFDFRDSTLQDMMGILLRVPELRDNLSAVTGGSSSDGDRLALIIKDWVSGTSITDIADKYFWREGEDKVLALTRCGRDLFGRLTQTASWGLGALLSITSGNLEEDHIKQLRNLPSRVFYGVNTDEAITFRLLGIPRSAAAPIAEYMRDHIKDPLPVLRAKLAGLKDTEWTHALGDTGRVYRDVWRILEGISD